MLKTWKNIIRILLRMKNVMLIYNEMFSLGNIRRTVHTKCPTVNTLMHDKREQ